MVLPGLVGLWLDGRWGTSPWLTLLGFVLGMVFAMWHLLRMTTSGNQDSASSGDSSAR
jgi:F0F1-type ATP synthase assembly protein I